MTSLLRSPARMSRSLSAAALVVISSLSAVAQAEEGSGYSGEALSQQGFQVAQGAGESVPGGTFLLLAYVAFFGLVVGYVGFLARRQRAVSEEFGALRRSVEDIDDRLDEIQGS